MTIRITYIRTYVHCAWACSVFIGSYRPRVYGGRGCFLNCIRCQLGMASRELDYQLKNRSSIMRGAQQSSPVPEVEKTSDEMEKTDRNNRKMAVICFLGIFVSYFIYGLLQEKMYVSSLVVCVCVCHKASHSEQGEHLGEKGSIISCFLLAFSVSLMLWLPEQVLYTYR